MRRGVRRELRRFDHENVKEVLSVAFSPDGQSLAVASSGGLVRIWDIKTKRELRRWDHAETVYAIAFSPDGRFVAAGFRRWFGPTPGPGDRPPTGQIHPRWGGPRRRLCTRGKDSCCWGK